MIVAPTTVCGEILPSTHRRPLGRTELLLLELRYSSVGRFVASAARWLRASPRRSKGWQNALCIERAIPAGQAW
jgi:hypothetical protein